MGGDEVGVASDGDGWIFDGGFEKGDFGTHPRSDPIDGCHELVVTRGALRIDEDDFLDASLEQSKVDSQEAVAAAEIDESGGEDFAAHALEHLSALDDLFDGQCGVVGQGADEFVLKSMAREILRGIEWREIRSRAQPCRGWLRIELAKELEALEIVAHGEMLPQLRIDTSHRGSTGIRFS